jgi:hypothetical protein
MIDLQDIDLIEGGTTCTEEQFYLALQRAINSGMGWKMQGSYGREMMGAIEAGYCMLGRDQCRDYYGNTIPSRDDVKQGTKGSYQYVIDNQGLEWADLMLEV